MSESMEDFIARLQARSTDISISEAARDDFKAAAYCVKHLMAVTESQSQDMTKVLAIAREGLDIAKAWAMREEPLDQVSRSE